jgi:hypothetical protein
VERSARALKRALSKAAAGASRPLLPPTAEARHCVTGQPRRRPGGRRATTAVGPHFALIPGRAATEWHTRGTRSPIPPVNLAQPCGPRSAATMTRNDVSGVRVPASASLAALNLAVRPPFTPIRDTQRPRSRIGNRAGYDRSPYTSRARSTDVYSLSRSSAMAAALRRLGAPQPPPVPVTMRITSP